MTRLHALADAYDRRFPFVPSILEPRLPAPAPQPGGSGCYPDDFWTTIRAEFTWLHQTEIAERHGVPLSTAKYWTARAFRGRP